MNITLKKIEDCLVFIVKNQISNKGKIMLGGKQGVKRAWCSRHQAQVPNKDSSREFVL
jgi:hypothetical protein